MPFAQRVLIASADPETARCLEAILSPSSVLVAVAEVGEGALARLARAEFDAIVVDLGSGAAEAIAMIRAVRDRGNQVPILVSAAGADEAKVVGALAAGADATIPDPRSPAGVQARVSALLRRWTLGQGGRLRVADLVLDIQARTVRGSRGDPLQLTSKEFALLNLLMHEPGRFFTRSELLDRVWGYRFDPGTNLTEVALSRLRRRIAMVSSAVSLRAVRGHGVRLETPASEAPMTVA